MRTYYAASLVFLQRVRHIALLLAMRSVLPLLKSPVERMLLT
ncbi:hypothetical protein PI124_g22020 [Phytophthora idaei]|nr:hypothetical protein PI124_g22020 [Phytophthora idaei]